MEVEQIGYTPKYEPPNGTELTRLRVSQCRHPQVRRCKTKTSNNWSLD